MVMHKTPLPYPTGSLPQPNFSSDDVSMQPSLIPDSTELPPVTRSPRDRQRGFQDSHNPWSNVSTHQLRADRPLPDILKPGGARTQDDSQTPAGQNSLANIPNILRAGQSQGDTPRSSLDSDRSKGFWEESDEEDGGNKSPERPGASVPDIERSHDPWINVEAAEKSPGIRRKPVAGGLSPGPGPTSPALEADTAFASNNPFRRPSYSQSAENGGPQEDKGKSPDRGETGPFMNQFQDLSIGNIGAARPLNNGLTGPELPAVKRQDDMPSLQPPMPQAPPPPPPPPPTESFSPFSSQPPLIPVSSESNHIENPWAAHHNLVPSAASPIPFAPSQKQVSSYNDDLLDRGHQNIGVVSLKDELETLPNAATTNQVTHDEPSLLEEDDETGPSLPTRPSQRSDTEYYDPPDGPPPSKAPRPSIRMTAPSEEEVAKMIEQRNETYQIKHFNWFDVSSRRLRRSSMLTQNKNGPCPLLALVNALILGAPNESQAVLDEALRSREQVTLGLIIETLMDELLSRGYENVGANLPDVDELNSFLMRLRTGMNANPRFVPSSAPLPSLLDLDDSMPSVPQEDQARSRLGTFESTTDMKLYGAFSVPLVHGWLPEPSSDAHKAFSRSAQTYEDAQALQFGEEELEYKLTREGLTPTEQNMWEDINAIKNFLHTYPTQLTPTGLKAVQSSIPLGSFAIMFRNDHFSTIYKHPESGLLFTLITDAGYADRDEVIWESLVDIAGTHNEFFSGDFMPVSHSDGVDDSRRHPASRRTSQLLPAGDPGSAAPLSPQEQQEQHDADFAMALQLQEEEEQRQRADRNRRRSTPATSTNNNSGHSGNNNGHGSDSAPRRSTGNIPIPLRSQPEVRPAIPPRNARAANPGVNRPIDSADEAPPPTYDEAAKGRPYIPPVGSPLHPAAEPSPFNSSTQLSGTISNTSGPSLEQPHPPGPNAPVMGGRRQPGRRLSAYNETSSYYPPQQQQQRMPGGYMSQQGVGAGPSRPAANMQGRDRDCIVM
ncbi:uncharacterized protein PV06_02981 [Exophiala oligosperma]|uniref:MINDY deubiquitinase domain-containing protein n=1 Tax=Exophiala oligosperma TaxID=215243 RepID=A0A0D2E9E6_9EURO|nr:uncharacterized protein PV06_02981 [Exophiala oligosperma]KIW44519.1 hypothetical protein PV06_02981 [Exophiala oligosperma]